MSVLPNFGINCIVWGELIEGIVRQWLLLVLIANLLKTDLSKTMNPLFLTKYWVCTWSLLIIFLTTWRGLYHFFPFGVLVSLYIVNNMFFLLLRQVLIARIFIIYRVIKFFRKVILKSHLTFVSPCFNPIIFFTIFPLGLFHIFHFFDLGSKVTLIIGDGPLHANVF